LQASRGPWRQCSLLHRDISGAHSYVWMCVCMHVFECVNLVVLLLHIITHTLHIIHILPHTTHTHTLLLSNIIMMMMMMMMMMMSVLPASVCHVCSGYHPLAGSYLVTTIFGRLFFRCLTTGLFLFRLTTLHYIRVDFLKVILQVTCY
jgi:hypothetical protein